MPTLYSSAEFVTVRSRAEQQLEQLFIAHQIPPSHGLDHARLVAAHMIATVEAHEDDEERQLTNVVAVSSNRQLALYLAALLHDADDAKYFARTNASSKMMNAVRICDFALEKVAGKQEIVAEVVEMISYVSMSENGNSVPDRAVAAPEFLWPRFCDRLEAIGTIGIIRTFQYNREKGMPLSSPTTPAPQRVEDVWKHVTPERVEAYCAHGSVSMMDHFYDKLLQIPAGFISRGCPEQLSCRHGETASSTNAGAVR